MRKAFNFSSGPAMLPYEVLNRAREELLDWNRTGMSPMEIPHRSPEFKEIREHVEASLRALLQVPAQYKILFLAGGARTQFAMLPLNLLGPEESADYLITGTWSFLAAEEASQFCKVNRIGEIHSGQPY